MPLIISTYWLSSWQFASTKDKKNYTHMLWKYKKKCQLWKYSDVEIIIWVVEKKKNYANLLRCLKSNPFYNPFKRIKVNKLLNVFLLVFSPYIQKKHKTVASDWGNQQWCCGELNPFWWTHFCAAATASILSVAQWPQPNYVSELCIQSVSSSGQSSGEFGVCGLCSGYVVPSGCPVAQSRNQNNSSEIFGLWWLWQPSILRLKTN